VTEQRRRRQAKAEKARLDSMELEDLDEEDVLEEEDVVLPPRDDLPEEDDAEEAVEPDDLDDGEDEDDLDDLPGAAKAAPKTPFTISSAKHRQRYLKAMVYGPYGVGKTVLSSTAQDVPEMRDTLVISAESGDLSIADRDDIDVIPISSYKQLSKVYEYLRRHCQLRDKGDLKSLAKLQQQLRPDEKVTRKNLKQYRTVIVDSLTELHKYCMYQLLGIEIGAFDLDMEPDNPQFAEWGKSGEMIRLFVRTLRDLPMHVIFVAAERTHEDEKKRRFFSPALPGQLSKDVQGFLDVVGYLRAGKAADGQGALTRRLYIQPDDRYDAKCRIRALDGITHFDNPTIADIVEGVI